MRTIIASLAVLGSGWGIAPAQAQSGLEEIVVTARKHEENLINIPVAVSVVSAEQLAATGLKSLQDLSKMTPGLDVQNAGSQSGGRYLAAIRFRGMSIPNLTPSFQVGALFLDGVFYLGGAQSINFDDVERVEVIRGPQSAYYGRSTFGGAINYITKDPSEHFQGKLSVEDSPSYKTNSYNVSQTLEGPLVQDRVSFRITGSTNQKGAQYTATDGGRIGQEKTSTVSGTLVFKPTDHLKFKLRGSYSADDDGAPTQVAFSYTRQGNCPTGTSISFYNSAGTRITGTTLTPLQCGAIPFNQPITSETRLPTGSFPAAPYSNGPGAAAGSLPLNVIDALVNNSFGNTILNGAPKVDTIGLKRRTIRVVGSFDYAPESAFSLSGNVAFDKQDTARIVDGDYSDTQNVYFATAYHYKDYSGELRLRYDDRGRLRAMLGGSYYKQTVIAGYNNAIEADYGFGGVEGAPASRPYPLGKNGDFDKITTAGVFGSVEYDIFDQLTAALEGRYQSDSVTRFGGTFGTGIIALPDKLESKIFLPRAILTYRPMTDFTVYASYSRGTLPGDINSIVNALTASDVAVAQGLLGGIQASVPSQKLDNYEIGIKQKLLDNKLRYALTGYYMNWQNATSTAQVYLPQNRITNFLVTGRVKIRGIEFESQWAPSPHWEFGVTGSYTHARYADFKLPGNGPIFGVNTLVGYNAKGNTPPRFPVWNGSLSAAYNDQLSEHWNWYLRGDAVMVGKSYIDETNLAWLSSYATVNAHLGVVRDDAFTVEIFVNNLFDKKAWGTGVAAFDLTFRPIQQPLAPGVTPAAALLLKDAAVNPIDRRATGVRMTYKF